MKITRNSIKKWGHDYMARIVPTILLHFLRPWRSDVGSYEHCDPHGRGEIE